MDAGRSAWALERFLLEFDLWYEREKPPDDVHMLVLAWIQGRMDDPYRGARREPLVDNLWLGTIPGTVDARQRVVVGSYFVFETSKLVRCNSFATLSLPI